MQKSELLDKVKAMNTLDKDKILGWVNALPALNSDNYKPNELRIGDVFMHPIFLHPYVLLAKKDSAWICCLLTTEASCPEVLDACQSRFFAKSFITKVLFTSHDVSGKFLCVYNNNKHLKIVLSELRKILK